MERPNANVPFSLLVGKRKYLDSKISICYIITVIFKKIISSLFVAFFLGLFNHSLIQASSKVQFSILYTNDVMGEVEPCG